MVSFDPGHIDVVLCLDLHVSHLEVWMTHSDVPLKSKADGQHYGAWGLKNVQIEWKKYLVMKEKSVANMELR